MENVGLQALSKLEDTIMKIIDLILKLLDQNKLKSQISDLKKENEDLKKQLEGKGDKESDKGDITISQKIKSNEKKIDSLQNQLGNAEKLKGRVEELKNDPEKRKALAQEALKDFNDGKFKNLGDAVVGKLKREIGGADQKSFDDILKDAKQQAENLQKGESVVDLNNAIVNAGLSKDEQTQLKNYIENGCDAKFDALGSGSNALVNLQKRAEGAFDQGKTVVFGATTYKRNDSGQVIRGRADTLKDANSKTTKSNDTQVK